MVKINKYFEQAIQFGFNLTYFKFDLTLFSYILFVVYQIG